MNNTRVEIYHAGKTTNLLPLITPKYFIKDRIESSDKQNQFSKTVGRQNCLSMFKQLSLPSISSDHRCLVSHTYLSRAHQTNVTLSKEEE